MPAAYCSRLELAPAAGTAQFVSAGHVASLMLGAGGDVRWLESTGTPLGLLPPGFPHQQADLRLAPGDCLVLYSDGVTEAQNETGDEFGEERLLHAVRGAGAEPAEVLVARVFDAIDGFVEAAPQFDDITLFVRRKLESER
jgi:phosphoserine phosphatase RsbU/P